jgi:hypothetical protein
MLADEQKDGATTYYASVAKPSDMIYQRRKYPLLAEEEDHETYSEPIFT